MAGTQTRQLAAIMFTDVAGYTALMQRDEETARSYRDRHRRVLEEAVPRRGGDLLEHYGDGSLSIFGSAIEAVACIQSIRSNQIHPTINYETPDPECDLDYVPNVARSLEVNNVLSNSFGFGGQNACIVFSGFVE